MFPFDDVIMGKGDTESLFEVIFHTFVLVCDRNLSFSENEANGNYFVLKHVWFRNISISI